MISVLWVAWLGCKGAEPGLVAQRRAVDHWREGRDLLEQGRSSEAVRAFDAALALQRGDPILIAWKAHAVAQEGDLEHAIGILDVGIAAGSEPLPLLRYNRASYLARGGDVQGAAEDLARAVEDGARPAREVLADPDFRDHLDHPALGFLPKEGLIVALDGPEGATFLGSRAEVRLTVLGTQPEGWTIIDGAVTGPVRLLSVVEDTVQSTEGPGRALVCTFEAAGPGSVRVGPLKLQSGVYRGATEGLSFDVVAPSGRLAPEALGPIRLETAVAVAGAFEVPSVQWAEGRLVVKVAAGDRVIVEPPIGPPDTTWELREAGRTQWVAQRWAPTTTPTKVRVVRQGATVLERAL